MWTSCCSWMCLDSVDDERGGVEPQHRSYTNSAFSTMPSPEHTCTACQGRLDTPTTKHVCADCRKNFCGRCSTQLEPRPRLCHTCQRFHGNLLQRAELMKLKVKELRDYLHLHGISTELCREKEELVELILGQQTPPSAEPPSVTPDQLDQTSHISTSSSEPPLAVPTETPEDAPTDPDSLDPDQGSDPEEEEEEAGGVPGRRASLSDLTSVDDIEALSVRQLKEILARNFVNFKGCCEKWELMERVTRLFHDHQTLSVPEGELPSPEGNICRICMDAPIDCVLLECGHMITCTKCGKRMNECPICRQYVIRAVHVFRS
ncbi:E3 ubiquitin-protein ligase rififylin [Nerophis lumbriciformis]|uniref:E3 ubiquitin-protein ligase rififylin n=1 Tax=Nerophis lumbriciformis TaxID=546530 RepID=UPI002ADF70DD|nr:E3 ubiquitin-protein ligase rififylin [Nerophis lumbriciformis]XP_061828429.1 E3 ubiquitin-protein ligase rififylin [Nerophis lumbriciformis]XP_061828430.1 E3 ubiquitin-protein ligase rififylin [Nerophis lumbriciformis]